MKSKSGFTLIEVMVVVIVLSIIVSIAVVAYNTQQKIARDNRTEVAAVDLVTALDTFYRDNGNFPVTCDLGSSSVLACANLSSTYTSSMTTPPTITPSTTTAQLRTFLTGLNETFAHPKAQSSNPINQLSSGAIKPDSFFLLSMDMVPGGTDVITPPPPAPDPTCPRGQICVPGIPGNPSVENNEIKLASATLAYNTGTVLAMTTTPTASAVTFMRPNGSDFTCNFELSGRNPAGSQDRRPHQYVVGYFSEETGTWNFYQQSASSDLNVLRWNTSGQALCGAQDIGALKSASLS